MNAYASVHNPDGVTVTVQIDMTIYELRRVLDEMDKTQYTDNTPFWIFKGHLERVERRIKEKVESREYEEKAR